MRVNSNLDAECALQHFFVTEEKRGSGDRTYGQIVYQHSKEVQKIIFPGVKTPIEILNIKAFKDRTGSFNRFIRSSTDYFWNERASYKNRVFFGRNAHPDENRVLFHQGAILNAIDRMEHKCLKRFVKEIHYAPLVGDLEKIFYQKKRAFAFLKDEVLKSSDPLIRGLDLQQAVFPFTASIKETTLEKIFSKACNPVQYVLELEPQNPFIFTPSTANPVEKKVDLSLDVQKKSPFKRTKDYLNSLISPINTIPETLQNKSLPPQVGTMNELTTTITGSFMKQMGKIADRSQKTFSRFESYFNQMPTPTALQHLENSFF